MLRALPSLPLPLLAESPPPSLCFLRTVDEYATGSNNSIQHANTNLEIDTVLAALTLNPDRKFICASSDARIFFYTALVLSCAVSSAHIAHPFVPCQMSSRPSSSAGWSRHRRIRSTLCGASSRAVSSSSSMAAGAFSFSFFLLDS